ncbi:sugar ABC transporter permease [Aquibacillus albus]|uniref:Arabinogalactan oligomer/maltooligosaccharide transport system permease protein n=1 Tax=Aquibacillus albus TaxID=1168171 RepID=A0ABS2MYC3_9BACI|nr:sugar ABC transporter permease [Aquibacillus albus]MBM7570826.1 arabinogalactan oligomer/maltooligosaccharide transport system permease protein [Aquibacillus albus]
MFSPKVNKIINLIIVYSILVLLVLICLFPVYFVFIGSVNPGESLHSSKIFPNPADWNWGHYKSLFIEHDYLNWYKNTLFIATANMVISTAFGVLSGYAFSKFKFKGKRQGLMAIIILQMFPTIMGMIAIYTLLGAFGLLDTHLGYILVLAAGSVAFNTWIVKGFFDGIPNSLQEAARIDGASNSDILIKIMLPLATPIIAFIAFNSFIGASMDFIMAEVILRSSENWTLAQGLFTLVSGQENNNFTVFAAGAVLISIPLMVLFFVFQRYIVEGLTAGAEKG